MKAGNWHKRAADLFEVEAHVNPRNRADYSGTCDVRITLASKGDDTRWLDVLCTPEEARDLAARLVRIADAQPTCAHDWVQRIGGVECTRCHSSRPGTP